MKKETLTGSQGLAIALAALLFSGAAAAQSFDDDFSEIGVDTIGVDAFQTAQVIPTPPAALPPPQDPRMNPPAASPGGSVPSPDPTILTIDALRREVAALKEILISVIDGKFAVIGTRLDASDKATSLLQETTDRQPVRIREAFDQLKAVLDERFAGVQTKFEGIDTQFTERDVRAEQAATATKIAVDAALQAAEKAVGAALVNSSQVTTKSEETFTKQIDGIGQLITVLTKTTDDKFTDLKDVSDSQFASLNQRIQAIESRTEGQTLQKDESSSNWGLVFGAVGMTIAVVSLIGGVLISVLRRSDHQTVIHDGPTATGRTRPA